MTATSVASKGLSPLGKAFFGSLCAGTFGLGCWQTQRFFEKQEMVEQREKDLARPPTPFDKETHNPSVLQRKILKGSYNHSKEVLVGPRGPPPGAMASTGPSSGRSQGGMSSSPQGYFVVTPLKNEEDGSVVLVNRGWIPRDKHQRTASTRTNANVPKDWNRPTGTVQVVGVPVKPEEPRIIAPQHNLTSTPPQLFYMDAPVLHQLLSSSGTTDDSTDSVYILQEIKSTAADESSSTLNFPVQPPLETVGEFKVTPAIHAGYAATWFGLAGAGIVMTRKLITRGR